MTTRPITDIILLQTKLNRPGVTKDLIIRPRLVKRLNAGLDGHITLVVAPAGFGKTTLVSSWLQTLSDPDPAEVSIPSAWLTLDEGDSDRDVFLLYFIAAVRTIFPDGCPETLALLKAGQEVPQNLIFNILTNELSLLPSRFILALDDLHTAQGGAGIVDLLSTWAHHWPPTIHLVLLSRYNPPLPLASLRAKGLLAEIRSRDLRFSPAETVEYFYQTLGSSSNSPDISLLQGRLAGWIAGLKMAVMSMSDPKDAHALTSMLVGGDIQITNYLMDEVYARQTPAIQEFLLKTSIADQFCTTLCEAILDNEAGDVHARECLDYLEAADLFMMPLDKQHEWYRYHDMFRDSLRQKLAASMSPAETDQLHLRAADWFAAHHLTKQAIAHALEAGSLESVARYMQQGLRDVLNREDRSTLERWLTLVPESFIQQSPELLVMRGFVFALRFEHERLSRTLEQAETLLEGDHAESRRALRGAIAMLKGLTFYYYRQPARVIPYCEEALALLPEDWVYARGNAGMYIGIGLYADGRSNEAEEFLFKAYDRATIKTDGYALRHLQALAINAVQAGNYEIAERTAQVIVRNCPPGRLPVILGWGHYLLGFVNYEWNDLDKAARHFEHVAGMYFTTLLGLARNGQIGQALVHQAQGREAAALETIDHLGQMDLEYRGREEIDTASSRARLLLIQGRQEEAERWAKLYNALPPPQALPPWIENPHLTRARILIARNQDNDLPSALQLLDEVAELADHTYNTRVTLEVLALRALALSTQGDDEGARVALLRSVELARKGIFTRVYVDLGSRMQQLLTQIAGHKSSSKVINRILAAFPGGDATPGQDTRPLGSQAAPAGDEQVIHLTPRELEVLTLLAEPISLKVIANRLNISYVTARRYTITLYGKFDVHSRWEAVDIAIRKGIISPN